MRRVRVSDDGQTITAVPDLSPARHIYVSYDAGLTWQERSTLTVRA